MLPTIDKTDAHLNIAEVAALLDVPPTELGIWRKVGLLPAPSPHNAASLAAGLACFGTRRTWKPSRLRAPSWPPRPSRPAPTTPSSHHHHQGRDK
jgi:hypothetical protein